MEVVDTFETLSKRVLEKYVEGTPITMGILVVDYRQTDAREFILNYLDRFDKKSGKFIDFYLPGYYVGAWDVQNSCSQHPNMYIRDGMIKDRPIYLSRTNEKVCFDEKLFEHFLDEMESRMNIQYSYSPMLILIEVKKSVARGEVEFQDKIVIDLDDGTAISVRKSGALFEMIFEIAKRKVNLDQFGKEIRMHYFKGNATKILSGLLKKDLVVPVIDNIEILKKYRIK